MQILTNAQRPQRFNRSPAFPVAGKMKPYGLYPVFGFPVLPGETLQSLSLKWRNVSMPVKHPLAGAWLECWAVYVKLTDINPDMGQMFISDTYTGQFSDTAGTDKPRFFTKTGQIRWIEMAVEAVHNAYFIHEDETARTIDGVPMVRQNNVGWYQNFIFEPADEAVPTTDASNLYAHLNEWAMLQQMQMTELTYEKYLETFGVSPKSTRRDDPEILRYARSWTQPVNTIDPTTGAPSSAWFWSDDVKLDKPKRFVEPGFVVVLATVRPKMFNAGIASSIIGNMWGFSDWYPSYNLSDPTAGVKDISTDDPVFAAATRADAGEKVLKYDHRDILSHGEQFINFDPATESIYDLPMSNGMNLDDDATVQDLRGQYCTATDVANLFVSATANDQFTNYEGIGQALISGHVTDTTR